MWRVASNGQNAVCTVGNNTLTGGPGADQFRDQAPNDGIDTITDFTPAVDKTQSLGSVFDGLAAGVVAAGKLVTASNPVASQASARFLLNTTTGMLAFDPDGTGAGAAVNLVTLASPPAITAADIVVVGV